MSRRAGNSGPLDEKLQAQLKVESKHRNNAKRGWSGSDVAEETQGRKKKQPYVNNVNIFQTLIGWKLNSFYSILFFFSSKTDQMVYFRKPPSLRSGLTQAQNLISSILGSNTAS